MRLRRGLVVGVVMAGLGLVAGPAFAAEAEPSAPVGDDAPSSCRPANHRAVVEADAPSAGHRHYRVALTAAAGYSDCTLAGVPADVVFRADGGGPLEVRPAPAPGPAQPLTFGPEHPVHFDIQVPNVPGGERASSVTFTLPAPDGVIPGEQEAMGPMEVGGGAQIGPVQAGR